VATSNLAVTELTTNQTGKTVTINDAFEKIDNATQDDLAVTFTSNLRTLTGLEFTSSFMFVAGTLSATGTLTVPLTRRFFAVDNTGSGHDLTVKGSTGATVSVASGDLAILYCNGTGIEALGGATGGGGGSPVTAAAILALDFSGAPTSDPGGGKLWLNGGVLQVGP
jgi:hypothetical protein